MRSLVAVAFTLAAASPLWAQTPPFVTGPRTLLPAHVTCTDVPVTTIPAPTLFVKGGHNADGHLNMSRGEIIVINRAVDDGMRVGLRYSTRRLPTGPIRFLNENEGFANVRVSGWVTIVALDGLNALAVIDHACDAVETGDYLEPYVELALPTAAEPLSEPLWAERANLLFGADRRLSFADGDVFSIDRGTVHGVSPGARFAIYRNIRDGLPLVYVGDVVVMEPGELTSKVVAVRVQDAIQPGDLAIPRRMP